MTARLYVLSMVKDRLMGDGGYDGLVSDGGECACLTGDLAPCGEIRGDCVAGHKGPCDPQDCSADGNCDFHIIAGRRRR